MLQRGSMFNGFTIEAADGKVGTVSDFLFDDTTWQLRWLVVDTGGWLSGRKILLHPASLEQPDVKGRAFPTTLTRKEVEASPDIAQDEPVSRRMEHDLSTYYGWQANSIGGTGFAAAAVSPLPVGSAETSQSQALAETASPADPHLRSMAEVTHYTIQAIDGTIGHLETFLIEDTDWTIRYLVVDTANWWLGKHVLVSPSSVKQFDWMERYVRLDLTCYKIKGSPAWDATGVVDLAYQKLLQIYYGWGSAGVAPASAAVPSPPAPVKSSPEKVAV